MFKSMMQSRCAGTFQEMCCCAMRLLHVHFSECVCYDIVPAKCRCNRSLGHVHSNKQTIKQTNSQSIKQTNKQLIEVFWNTTEEYLSATWNKCLTCARWLCINPQLWRLAILTNPSSLMTWILELTWSLEVRQQLLENFIYLLFSCASTRLW